jgi:hypothetical protein
MTWMWKSAAAVAVCLTIATEAGAQEARRRWEMQRQIRLDKFEQILPLAMKNNNIDMWLVAVKENHIDPLWRDLGRGLRDRHGLPCSSCAATAWNGRLGPSGYLINESGAYGGDCGVDAAGVRPSAIRNASASTCRRRSVRPTDHRDDAHHP